MDDISSQPPQYIPPRGVPPLEQGLVFPAPGKQTGFMSVWGRGAFRGEIWSPPAGANPFVSGMVMTVQRIMVESQRQQLRWNSTVMVMRESVRSLTNEVAMLKSEIQRLHQLRTYVVPLTTLAPEPFKMLQQIPVTIEGDGEDFTATFVEANVSASGDTEADAISNFKESLVSSYEVLEDVPTNQMGPLPARQWVVLQSVVKRVE